MQRYCLLLTTLVCPGLAAQAPVRVPPDSVCEYRDLFVDSCFTIRGRLQAANGYPPYRVWVVGTRRVLGVDIARGCVLPAELERLLGVEDQQVYADFVVRPLTPDQPGVMRMVCIASASNLVTRSAYFLRDPPS